MAKPKGQTVRFNTSRLNLLADKMGRSAGDMLDALAYAVLTGNAPPHIRNLLADAYDDAISHTVVGSQSDTYFLTSDPHAARQEHKLEYELGTAIFLAGLEGIDRRMSVYHGRLLLCFGYEYFDWREIETMAKTCGLNVGVCSHLTREAQEMAKVTAARIWYDDSTGTYAMVTPYDDRFVNWLKLVSKQHKFWNHEEKIWYIAPQVLDEVRGKIKDIFGECAFQGPGGAKLAAPAPSDMYGKFCKLLGAETLGRAWRDAAKRYHTDTGVGDHDKMAELNALWAQIKETLK